MNNNSIKKAFTKRFDALFKVTSSDISIYKNWDTQEMSIRESRAINEKPGIFEFPLETDIKKDDVIQIKNSKSFWKVIDIDEHKELGSIISLYAKVIKIDERGNEISINSKGRAVFNAPVYGGVQVGGYNNAQNNTININSDFNNAIEKLLALIENSSISSIQKITAKSDVHTLKKLAALEHSPDVLALASTKIEAVKDVISMTADMTSLGIVLIPIIQTAFGI